MYKTDFSHKNVCIKFIHCGPMITVSPKSSKEHYQAQKLSSSGKFLIKTKYNVASNFTKMTKNYYKGDQYSRVQ